MSFFLKMKLLFARAWVARVVVKKLISSLSKEGLPGSQEPSLILNSVFLNSINYLLRILQFGHSSQNLRTTQLHSSFYRTSLRAPVPDKQTFPKEAAVSGLSLCYIYRLLQLMFSDKYKACDLPRRNSLRVQSEANSNLAYWRSNQRTSEIYQPTRKHIFCLLVKKNNVN